MGPFRLVIQAEIAYEDLPPETKVPEGLIFNANPSGNFARGAFPCSSAPNRGGELPARRTYSFSPVNQRLPNRALKGSFSAHFECSKRGNSLFVETGDSTRSLPPL